jgi:hypothetical protein
VAKTVERDRFHFRELDEFRELELLKVVGLERLAVRLREHKAEITALHSVRRLDLRLVLLVRREELGELA